MINMRNNRCEGCKNYFIASVGVMGAHYLCEKGRSTILPGECEDFEDAETKHDSKECASGQ